MRQEPETEILRKEGKVVGFPGFSGFSVKKLRT